MKIIDMHCDTISELADRGGELWKNSGHLDLKRMQESGYLLQNFACLWISESAHRHPGSGCVLCMRSTGRRWRKTRTGLSRYCAMKTF